MAQLGNTGINGNLMVVGTLTSSTAQIKLINGGGGNSLIQQNSDTSGSDITVGSTSCNLKIQGKADRPMYKKTGNEYTDIALSTDVANSGYGTCATASGTDAKVVTISDTNWKLKTGCIIGVKFTNTNTASNVTLNVNSSGAKQIYANNSVYTGASDKFCGYANRCTYYMYDGTNWVWLGFSNVADTFPSGMCYTAADTAAKTVTCHNYSILNNSYLQIIIVNANTSSSALTLNVNGKGAKPIYINGSASSSSNYTLPAGSYLTYYNGTNYYFSTNGMLFANNIKSTTGTTSVKNDMSVDGNITSTGNVQCSKLNGKTPLTASYDSTTKTLTLSGG